VRQISEGSLQELFQKLLKAEEVIKERERERRSSNRSLETKEPKAKYYGKPIVSSRSYSHAQ